MPFNCDVCGNEVPYSEKVFVLENKAEIVICKKCLGRDDAKYCMSKRPLIRKTICQQEAEHDGSCRAVIFWEKKE